MARFLFINAMPDQPIIAEQVANIGAGMKSQMQSLTAKQLCEAADHVFNLSSFRKAAAIPSKIRWVSSSC